MSHLQMYIHSATIGNGSCTGDSIKGPEDGDDAPYYGFSCTNMKGVLHVLFSYDSPERI